MKLVEKGRTVLGGFRATLEWFLARLGRCCGPVCQHDDLERNTSRRRISDEHLSHRRQIDQGGNGRRRNTTSAFAFLGKMVRGHCISRTRSPGWLIILESLSGMQPDQSKRIRISIHLLLPLNTISYVVENY